MLNKDNTHMKKFRSMNELAGYRIFHYEMPWFAHQDKEPVDLNDYWNIEVPHTLCWSEFEYACHCAQCAIVLGTFAFKLILEKE